MADLYVADQLYAYLIAQGLAQDWNTTVSSTVPGIMRNPRDGAPAPRPGETATITLVDTMLAPAGTLEAWIEEAFIDVIVQSANMATIKFTHRQIAGLLHPNSAHGGRKMWQMGAINPVLYSMFWRGEQDRPSSSPKIWARSRGYRIGVPRTVLAGLPYPQ
jgi:hypothetical protein